MRKSKTDPEDIKRLRSEGHSYRDINREIGATMYLIAKHAENKKPVKVVPLDVKEKIAMMAKCGAPLSKIQEETGASESTIRRIAVRFKAKKEARHSAPPRLDEYKEYSIVFHEGWNHTDVQYHVIAKQTLHCYPNYFDLADICAEYGIYYEDFVDLTPASNHIVRGLVLVAKSSLRKAPKRVYYTITQKKGGPPNDIEIFR